MSYAFYGSPEQMRLMAKGLALWRVCGAVPGLSYNGRFMSFSAATVDDPVATSMDMARLQGGTSVHYLPWDDAKRVSRELEDAGFGASIFHQYVGGDDAYEKAKAFLSQTALPDGFRVLVLDPASPEKLVREVAELMLSVGVTPSCELGLRGMGPPGLCVAIVDTQGSVTAAGASFLGYPRSGPHGDSAFWGMLATRDDCRGLGLAAQVGCRLIRHMWEENGAREFITGVHPDNPVSAKVCARMGVMNSPFAFLGCTDPEAFGEGRLTR